MQEKREIILFKDSGELTSVDEFKASVEAFFKLPPNALAIHTGKDDREAWRDILFKIRRNLAVRDSITIFPTYHNCYQHIWGSMKGISMRFSEISANRHTTKGSVVNPGPITPEEARLD